MLEKQSGYKFEAEHSKRSSNVRRSLAPDDFAAFSVLEAYSTTPAKQVGKWS